jgi:mono/diheme cytochrome c family protein
MRIHIGICLALMVAVSAPAASPPFLIFGAPSAPAAAASLPQEHLAAGSFAARAVDGARIAAERCDGCHMLRPPPGSAAAPTYAEIAMHRTAEQVRGVLAKSHGRTPAAPLSNDQIDDVIAYLKSFSLY